MFMTTLTAISSTGNLVGRHRTGLGPQGTHIWSDGMASYWTDGGSDEPQRQLNRSLGQLPNGIGISDDAGNWKALLSVSSPMTGLGRRRGRGCLL